jgi:hypothetical protein
MCVGRIINGCKYNESLEQPNFLGEILNIFFAIHFEGPNCDSCAINFSALIERLVANRGCHVVRHLILFFSHDLSDLLFEAKICVLSYKSWDQSKPHPYKTNYLFIFARIASNLNIFD